MPVSSTINYSGYGNSPYGYAYGDPLNYPTYTGVSTLAVIANLVSNGGVFIFGPVTATGAVGNFVTFSNTNYSASSHTIQYVVTGTPPSSCTLSLDGSLDGVNWVSLSGPITATSTGMQHFANMPVAFIRVSCPTYAAGDSTTQIIVSYARGSQ